MCKLRVSFHDDFVVGDVVKNMSLPSMLLTSFIWVLVARAQFGFWIVVAGRAMFMCVFTCPRGKVDVTKFYLSIDNHDFKTSWTTIKVIMNQHVCSNVGHILRLYMIQITCRSSKWRERALITAPMCFPYSCHKHFNDNFWFLSMSIQFTPRKR